MKMQTFDPDGKTNRMSMTMVPLCSHGYLRDTLMPRKTLHLQVYYICTINFVATLWDGNGFQNFWRLGVSCPWFPCRQTPTSKRTWYAQLAGVAAVNLFVFSNKHRQVQRAATPRTALHVNHSKSLLIAAFGGFPKMGGSPKSSQIIDGFSTV